MPELDEHRELFHMLRSSKTKIKFHLARDRNPTFCYLCSTIKVSFFTRSNRTRNLILFHVYRVYKKLQEDQNHHCSASFWFLSVKRLAPQNKRYMINLGQMNVKLKVRKDNRQTRRINIVQIGLLNFCLCGTVQGKGT